MIAYLRGRVLMTTTETAVLDVNGVGYEAYCSGEALRKLVVGEIAELYTYLQAKEDGVTLFGFESIKEKEMFLRLITVSGVGPKLAISVFASLRAEELASAIFTADVKRLSAVKGLGKKTAEKIVLELHGKISAAELLDANGDGWQPAQAEPSGRLSAEDEEAVSALTGLGFTRTESVQAVKRARENGARTLEEVIRKALQGS